MRWAWHVPRMEEMRNAYKILVEKPVGKWLLGRPRLGWEDNIWTDCCGDTRWKVLDWIHVARKKDQWRVFVHTVMKVIHVGIHAPKFCMANFLLMLYPAEPSF
jgi:hypothetical protein